MIFFGNDILFRMKHTIIYCDGSSIGNPGPGGWGAVVSDGVKIFELGGFDPATTNNRMELTAAIESLKKVGTSAPVALHTDSQYVINGITKWVFGWQKNGWQTKEKKEVLNKDLWQALLLVVEKRTVDFVHVRGHEGVRLNERADMIANGYARKEEVKLFSGTAIAYETFLEGMPKARVVKSSASKKGKAYSYVSVIDRKVVIHTTWGECEARVKGKKAKFKKVFSKEEESLLKREWSA